MTEETKRPSQYIRDNKDSLISEWEKEARKKVKAAADAHPLVLRDHLPTILEDLQDALSRVGSEEDARNAGSYAFSPARSVEHGQHRASTENYTVDQVIHEFIILRHILTDRLRNEAIGGPATVETINRVLELGMLKSCAAFSDSLQQVQQKLVGTLAHDIRTPISIAHTSLELLDANELDPHEAKDLRQMARRGIGRALEMLADLLDSIRVKGGEGIFMQFEETDYVAELREAYEGIKLIYGNQVQLELPQRSVKAVLCASGIRRVLENLVSNAVKHGDRGRPISIALDEGEEDVLLSVRNEGNPIPEDQQRRIFKFLNKATGSAHTTDDSWGMGLTLVKIVAEAHKGDVRIESAESEGTRFVLRLSKRPHPPGRTRVSLNPGEDR